MKEKLEQLDILLKEIGEDLQKEIETHKLLQDITVEEWRGLIASYPPELIDRSIDHFINKKKDKELFEIVVPRIKTVVERFQVKLTDLFIENNEKNDREFIRKIVQNNILDEHSIIRFGNTKNRDVCGYLTPSGDFKVNISGEIKIFTSFFEAAKTVNGRAKDGWSDWVANDEFGQPQNLKFFKERLALIMSNQVFL